MTRHSPDQDPAREGSLPAVPGIEPRRRRLVTAVLGGGGVLLAVQARTALGAGGVCQSPSAMISGNTSPHPGVTPPPCSGGLSPGFWRNPQHVNAWVVAVPATFKNVATCPTGLGKMGPENIATQGTTVTSVFGSAATNLLTTYTYTDANGNTTIYPTDWGLWGVLAFPKEAGINEGDLLWHLIAAYLNSLAFSNYALTTKQVKDAAAALLPGGSGAYCPDGIVCDSKALTASQFVSYISGMYDINASLTFELCKAK